MRTTVGAATLPPVPLIPTLALLAAFALATLFTGWRGARPPDPHRGVRMMPWRFLMVLSAAVASLLLIHVVSLLSGPA